MEQNGQESFLLFLQVIDYGKQIAAQLYLCLSYSVAAPVGSLKGEAHTVSSYLRLGRAAKETGKDSYHVQVEHQQHYNCAVQTQCPLVVHCIVSMSEARIHVLMYSIFDSDIIRHSFLFVIDKSSCTIVIVRCVFQHSITVGHLVLTKYNNQDWCACKGNSNCDSQHGYPRNPRFASSLWLGLSNKSTLCEVRKRMFSVHQAVKKSIYKIHYGY